MSGQCPACGSTRVVEIFWGMPTEEDFHHPPAGVRFGGCMLPAPFFSRECEDCGARWDPPKPRLSDGT